MSVHDHDPEDWNRRHAGRIKKPLDLVYRNAAAKKQKAVSPEPTPIDCKSDVGVTIALIDSIIGIATILVQRKEIWEHPEVVEALRDLRYDADVLQLMKWNMPMETAENTRIMNAINDAHALMLEKGLIPKNE